MDEKQPISDGEPLVTITIPADSGNNVVEKPVETIPEISTGQVQQTPPEQPSAAQPQVEEKKEEIVTTNPQNQNKEAVKVEKIACKTNHCTKKFDTEEEFSKHVKEVHVGAGRPCTYCLGKSIIQTAADNYLKKCYESKPQQIPFIEELALILNVDEDTILLWAKRKLKNAETGEETNELEHPDFFGVYNKLKTLQKLFLSKRILGRYNPTGAISLLKWHHGLIETTKQIQAGDKDNPLEYKIKIVEEKPQPSDD